MGLECSTRDQPSCFSTPHKARGTDTRQDTPTGGGGSLSARLPEAPFPRFQRRRSSLLPRGRRILSADRVGYGFWKPAISSGCLTLVPVKEQVLVVGFVAVSANLLCRTRRQLRLPQLLNA